MSFWNKNRAEYYINTYGIPTDPTPLTYNRMKQASSYILKGDVLDVGCGVGHLYPHIKNFIENYLGLDASPYMLEKARYFFPEAKWIEGDIYELKNQVGLFNTVYCLSLLIHLYDLENAIKQLWSRTKKRLILLLPLARKKEIIEAEPELIYHFTTRKNLYKIIDSLPDVKNYRIRIWDLWRGLIKFIIKGKWHYFIILDRCSHESKNNCYLSSRMINM